MICANLPTECTMNVICNVFTIYQVRINLHHIHLFWCYYLCVKLGDFPKWNQKLSGTLDKWGQVLVFYPQYLSPFILSTVRRTKLNKFPGICLVLGVLMYFYVDLGVCVIWWNMFRLLCWNFVRVSKSL